MYGRTKLTGQFKFKDQNDNKINFRDENDSSPKLKGVIWILAKKN